MTQRAHILLADDQAAVTSQLAPVLDRAGYQVTVVTNGQAVLDFVRNHSADLIVLDVDMPGMDGREALRRLRQADNWVPVIILSNHGDDTEQTQAIAEGADDYLNKPYSASRLVAHIGAVLRRIALTGREIAKANRLVSGALIVDKRSRRVWMDQRELKLAPKAAALLLYLMSHPQQIFSREQLLNALWGREYIGSERAVIDPRIAEIRKALGDDPDRPHYIESIRGEGYRFIGEVEGAK
jgi:DNA-binding response OmpR family regulator